LRKALETCQEENESKKKIGAHSTKLTKDIKVALSLCLVRKGNSGGEAEKLMDEILIEDPDCLFSLIDLAKLSQNSDFEKSLDHYLQALKLLEAQSAKKIDGKKTEDIRYSDIVSPHLYNNIGVLCIKVKKYDEAK